MLALDNCFQLLKIQSLARSSIQLINAFLLTLVYVLQVLDLVLHLLGGVVLDGEHVLELVEGLVDVLVVLTHLLQVRCLHEQLAHVAGVVGGQEAPARVLVQHGDGVLDLDGELLQDVEQLVLGGGLRLPVSAENAVRASAVLRETPQDVDLAPEPVRLVRVRP